MCFSHRGKRIRAFISRQERSRLARSRQHKSKLAAEEERFHDIIVDKESSLYSIPCMLRHAVAASAGAVPATPAGSGDGAVLGGVVGAANTT